MNNPFEKFKHLIESDAIQALSEAELKHVTGGTYAGAAGSQTSGTGSQSATCCDASCVCVCYPVPVEQ